MTPANLRALRMRLGLGPKDAAEILGITVGQIETMERANFNNVFMVYYEALARIEYAMLHLIDAICEDKPTILIGYKSTEDMLMFRTGFGVLRSHQVHRMALAQAQAILNDESPAHQVNIIEMIPERYREFLAANNLPENEDSRERWAWERLAQFKIIPPGG